MTTQPHTLPPGLLDLACQRFRQADPFAWHCARGKLGHDAVFAELLRQDLLPRAPRVLDLGCGQGSLFALLLAAAELYDQGRWPRDWPAPSRPRELRGVELMPRDAWRAARAFGAGPAPVRIERGDMNAVDLGACDAVVILDALHYFSHDLQRRLLARIRSAMAPAGRLIVRVGDAAGGLRFKLSLGDDHVVTFGRGHRLPHLYCRSLDDWRALLTDAGFAVRALPMNGALPFANVLLVCDVAPGP